MGHFNNLTPAEVERIALLMEECGEVVQICGKILRHGFDSYNPYDGEKKSNRSLLEKEIGDVEFSIKLMIDQCDICPEQVTNSVISKSERVWRYMHHNKVKP